MRILFAAAGLLAAGASFLAPQASAEVTREAFAQLCQSSGDPTATPAYCGCTADGITGLTPVQQGLAYDLTQYMLQNPQAQGLPAGLDTKYGLTPEQLQSEIGIVANAMTAIDQTCMAQANTGTPPAPPTAPVAPPAPPPTPGVGAPVGAPPTVAGPAPMPPMPPAMPGAGGGNATAAIQQICLSSGDATASQGYCQCYAQAFTAQAGAADSALWVDIMKLIIVPGTGQYREPPAAELIAVGQQHGLDQAALGTKMDALGTLSEQVDGPCMQQGAPR